MFSETHFLINFSNQIAPNLLIYDIYVFGNVTITLLLISQYKSRHTDFNTILSNQLWCTISFNGPVNIRGSTLLNLIGWLNERRKREITQVQQFQGACRVENYTSLGLAHRPDQAQLLLLFFIPLRLILSLNYLSQAR